jgi:hypothetical protein
MGAAWANETARPNTAVAAKLIVHFDMFLPPERFRMVFALSSLNMGPISS